MILFIRSIEFWQIQFLKKYDLVALNGLEPDASQFHTELCTIPLFDSKRILVVRHADALFKLIHSNATLFKYFERDLKQIPETTHLLLQFDSTSFPAGFSFLENIAEIIYKTKPLYKKDILGYLKKKAKILEYTIDEGVIELLIEKCAWDSKNSMRMFDLLVLYAKKDQRITHDMVNKFCHDLEGDLYFEILDHLSEKRLDKCIHKINQHKIIDGNQLFFGFVKIFTDSFRYMQFKNISISIQDIYKQLEFNTMGQYILKKTEQRIQTMIRSYSDKEIKLILNKLLELDKRLKSESSEKHRTLLIMFVNSIKAF